MRFKLWFLVGMVLCLGLFRPSTARTQDERPEPLVMGISAYWAGDYEGALIAVEYALSLTPENAEALAYRGAIHERQNLFERAETAYAQSLALTPISEDDKLPRKPTLVEVLKADIEIDHGNSLDSAITGLDLTRAEPDNPLGYYLMGRSVLLDPQSNPASAIPYFDNAIEYDTKIYPGLTASLYASRADAYRRIKKYDEAVADVETALESYTDHHSALRIQGHISLDQADYELSISQLSYLLDLYPSDVFALALRGETYFLNEEYDLAFVDLDAAIAYNAFYTFPRNRRAQIYLMRGEHQKAVEDLTIVLDEEPEYAYGFAMRGEAYGWLGEPDKSLDDLNRSIDLFPTGAYAWLNRGITYSSMGEYDLAMTNLNEAIRLAPDYRNAYYARMRIAFAHRQYQLAFNDFIQLIIIDASASMK